MLISRYLNEGYVSVSVIDYGGALHKGEEGESARSKVACACEQDTLALSLSGSLTGNRTPSIHERRMNPPLTIISITASHLISTSILYIRLSSNH